MFVKFVNESNTIATKLMQTNLDKVDQKDFEEYYYLYEYSDNIQLITDNPLFPSMLNYVKTGILTEEEMIQALLYKQV